MVVMLGRQGVGMGGSVRQDGMEQVMSTPETSWDVEAQPQAYGLGTPAPADLQTRLARAYLAGDGAEVERVLALIAKADYTLPPKSPRAA
jgi:hypothetical protein